jgi:diguanylate cyclase (GGDEF)-like protein
MGGVGDLPGLRRLARKRVFRLPGESPVAATLALGVLYFAGGALGGLTLLLPHPATFDDTALWSNVGLAFVSGVVLLVIARGVPRWAVQVLLAIGTLVITRAVYYSMEPSGYYAFFYVWVGLYAFFFFGRFWGLVQMAILGGSYAWVLTQVPQSTGLSRWLMLVGTITVSGFLVDALARRVRQRAAEADGRARALAAVDVVAHELARRTTPEAAGPAICEATLKVAEADGASLWEPTTDGGGLEVTASTDPGMIGVGVRFLGETSGAIRAFTSREQFFVPEAKGDAAVNQALVERFGVHSILFQPVLRDDVPIGVLVVFWASPVPLLDDPIEQTVALLAAEASLAIERAELLARLERAARTDDLTGLANRRAWDEYLIREVSRARRLSASLCVAMLDLDYFKDYNDRNGHQAGDRLLKEAAARWGAHVRETDLLARYGGEEFAVAMPDCDLERASEVIERIRAATPEGEKASAGVVVWDGEESEIQLVARADQALYKAKRGGRDRVETA